jgi:hypothetical protein
MCKSPHYWYFLDLTTKNHAQNFNTNFDNEILSAKKNFDVEKNYFSAKKEFRPLN